jgi:hypothetical protein
LDYSQWLNDREKMILLLRLEIKFECPGILLDTEHFENRRIGADETRLALQ